MQSKGLFIFSLLISVYSIALFALGIFQVLTREYVLSLTLLFIGCLFITIKKSFNLFSLVYLLKKRKYIWFFVPLVLINLVGALGPELGFDALWYHLTIPKLYIERGQIDFIPGGLLYYSAMPKLIDLLYIPILIFSNEVGVKLLSLLFGFLTAVVTYKIARLFLNERLSILAALIFYSNLVVMWLSITAYIDLGRAFYASLAVYTLLLYLKDKKRIYFFLCAVLIGFEISTKLLGVGTLIVVSIVIFSISKETLLKRISEVLKFISISLAVVSPWLVFSFINTGSLIYPFFSNVYPSTTEFGLSPFSLFSDLTMLFFVFPRSYLTALYSLISINNSMF